MQNVADEFAAGYLLGRKKGKGKLTTKTITDNGTYKAKDEPVSQDEKKYDGYSEVTVNLALGTKTIVSNDTYPASADSLKGYSSVTVNVPTYEQEYEAMLECFDDVADIIEENTGTRPQDCAGVKDALEDAYEDAHLINPITITDNGTYTASGNVDGYSPVTVALPLGTKTITDNGTYAASGDNLKGYSSVTVALPLGTKTVTENAAYTASTDGLKGYSEFTVNVRTYKPEYDALVECQQEVAALLGLTPPYDCDDIKQAITERGGYEPPIGTEINDILKIAKADPVTDETVGKTIVTYLYNVGGIGHLYVRVRYTDGHEEQIFGREYGDVAFDTVEYAILDSSTGRISGYYTYHSPGGTSTTETFDYTVSYLIGYGAAGHQYKVQNQ